MQTQTETSARGRHDGNTGFGAWYKVLVARLQVRINGNMGGVAWPAHQLLRESFTGTDRSRHSIDVG